MAHYQDTFGIKFNADITDAKSKINQLYQSLQEVMSATSHSTGNFAMTTQIKEANMAAMQLQAHLNQAVNVNTGKLNLLKLNSSLKQSGTSLQALTTKIQAIGPVGQQAFLNLAAAVTKAETPVISLGAKLQSFGKTFVSAVKWQAAYGIINGITSTLQGAVAYAEKLNTALNSIQVVSGRSTDSMESFVKTAQKMAKELNTTTTAYSEAALIFFQQGLSEDAVIDRVNTVIKMANVTGETASKVSDQMTAVWNNFYDGSKTLEYYADAMTALGAATASSTNEIADGLEKFAAIADTVGLSYEYATAALATVTAQTRQSADVVGTSFKTLFSRLESLSLGETLDDGTTLGKYSQALATVGVNIKDQNGELKDMDNILDELGAKWEKLSKDQQVALAQTVGGVRQYTQLISLMDNYQDFKINVDIASNAEGTLDKQAEIWAESYEAAAQRVKEAKNQLGENFLNSDDVILFTNAWADVISGFDKAIDSAGGIVRVILQLAGMFSGTLIPILSMAMNRIREMFNVWSGKALQQVVSTQDTIKAELEEYAALNQLSEGRKQEIALLQSQLQLRQEVMLLQKNMSVADQNRLNIQMSVVDMINQETEAILKKKIALEDEIATEERKLNFGPNRRGLAKEAALNLAGEGMSDKNIKEAFSPKTSVQLNTETKFNDVSDQLRLAQLSKSEQLKQAQLMAQNVGITLKDNETDAWVSQIGIDKARITRQMNKTTDEGVKADLQEEYKIRERIQALIKQTPEETKKEIEKLTQQKQELQQILEVRKAYNEQKGKNVEDIIFSKDASINADDMNEGLQSYNLSNSQQSTIKTEFNAQMADLDLTGYDQANGTMDVTIGNFKKLSVEAAKAQSQYNSLTAIIKKTNNVFDIQIQDVNKARQALEKATREAKKNGKEIDKGSKEYKEYQQALKKLQTAIKPLEKEITVLAKDLNLTEQETNELTNNFTKLAQGGDVAETAFADIINRLTVFQAKSDVSSTGMQELAEQMAIMISSANPTLLEPYLQKLEALGIKTEELRIKLGQTSPILPQTGNGLQQIGAGAMKMVSSVGMALSGWQSLTHAFDEGLSPLERLTTLFMALPMTISGVKGAYEGLTTVFNKNTLTTLKNWAAKKLAEEQAKKNAMATGVEATAEEIETMVKNTNTVAEIWNQAIKQYGPVIGAAVAAAAMAVFVAVTASTAALNDNTEAEIANQEAASKAAEEYDKAKEAHEQLMETISKYETASEELENLAAGTEEYTTKLQEANEAAIELLETAEGLTTKDFYWKDGQLIINEDALDRAEESSKTNLDLQYATKMMSNIALKESQLLTQQIELAEDMSYSNAEVAWATLGAAVTGGILTMNPGGAAIGGIATYNSMVSAQEDALNATQILANAYAKNPEAIDYGEKMSFDEFVTQLEQLNLDGIDLQDEDLIQELYNNRETIAEFADTLSKTSALREAYSQQIVNEVMADSNLQNTKIGKEVINSGGDTYNKLWQEAYDKYNTTEWTEGFFNNYGTDEAKEMMHRYAEIMELDQKSGFEITDYDDDNSVQYTYIDENGEEVEATVTREMIAQTLASADANGMLEDSLYRLNDIVVKLASSTSLADQAMAKIALGKDISDLTLAEGQALIEEEGLTEDILNNDEEFAKFLDKKYGDGKDGKLSKETLTALGYTSLEEAIEGERAKLAGLFDEENIANAKMIISLFGENIGKYTAYGGAQSYKNQNSKLGIEGSTVYENLINTAIDSIDFNKLSDEEKEEFFNKLFALDSEDYNFGYELTEVVNEYGGYIDTSTESWQKQIFAMRDAVNAVPDLSQMRADLEAIVKLSEEIEIGKTVTKEDFDSLIQYNNELRNYFRILSDGSAVFTGDLLDFQQAINFGVKQARDDAFAQGAKNYNDIVNIRGKINNWLEGLETEEITYTYNTTDGEEYFIDSNGEKYSTEEFKNIYNNNPSRFKFSILGNTFTQDGTGDLTLSNLINTEAYISGDYEGALRDFITTNYFTENDIQSLADSLGIDTTETNGNTDEIIAQIAEDPNFALLGEEAYDEQLTVFRQATEEVLAGAKSAQEREQYLEEALTAAKGDEKLEKAATEAYSKIAEQNINEEAYEGLNVEEVQEYATYLEEAYGIAEEGSEEVARATMKMNQGLTTLTDNWEDWYDLLKSGKKNTQEYAKALNEVKNAVGDLLDVDEDFISSEFIANPDNVELLNQAVNGSTEAIDKLGFALAENMIDSLNLEDNNLVDNFKNSISQMQDFVLNNEINPGDMFNETSFDSALNGMLSELNNFVQQSGMSVEQANAFYRSLGFTPKFKTVKVRQPIQQTLTNKRVYSKTENSDLADYDTKTTYYEEAESQTRELGANEETLMAWTADGSMPEIEQISSTAEVESLTYTGGSKTFASSSPSKSGGGGGGSKQEKKKSDDEKERYHVLERQLAANERATKRLGESKDLAFGASKVEWIDRETAALREELVTLQALDDEIVNYLAQDKANLMQLGTDYGITVEFDENENIINYDALFDAAIAEYNAAVDAINAGSMTEDEFAKAEEKYEEFTKFLEQYEETLDKWEDNQDDIIAKQRELVEQQMKKIELQVQLKLDVAEDSLEYLEYHLSKIEDEAFAAADAIALINQEVGVALNQSSAYQQGIADLEVLAASNLAEGIATESDGWTEEMIDQLREYRSGLLETNQLLDEYRTLIEEKIITALDEVNEKLDEQISRFDSYGAILENYTNILGLTGKSIKNAGLIIELGNKSVDNAINKLASTKEKQDTLQSALQDAEREYQEAINRGDSESVEYWKEQIDDLEIRIEQGKEELLANFEETLTTAADIFASAVEQTVAILSSALSRFDSLDKAADQFEKSKTLAEQFLSVNTQVYELSKLMRNINGEIAKTDNLAAKTKLRDVLEEINDIQANNTKLTQYDLDMLNARYRLRLAEIALEEAQNAKSQVRLTQTAGGGWGYVYTADQSAIDSAQQNYEDKLYEMQKLAEERIDELSDSIIANEQEFIEAMSSLRAEDFENYEAYLSELNRLKSYYTERDAYLREQFGNAVDDAGISYQDTLLAQVEPAANSWEEAHQNMVNSVETAMEQILVSYQTWQEQVDEAYTAAGMNSEGFREQIESDVDKITTASNEAADSIEELATEAKQYLSETSEVIGDFQTQYSEMIEQLVNLNEQTVTSLNSLIEHYSNVAKAAEESAQRSIEAAQQSQSAWQSASADASGSGDNPTYTGPNLEPNGEDYVWKHTISNSNVTKWKGQEYVYLGNNTYALKSDIQKGDLLGGSMSGNNAKAIYGGKFDLQYFKYWSGTGFSGFIKLDTGGYTGDWNSSEGRIAMLHEKEIVLNKADTKNLLTSVEIVRSIAQSIDAMGRYQRTQELINSASLNMGNIQPFEQNVHISADFPSVTDHNEIEEALSNLMNYASQYVNRYNK